MFDKDTKFQKLLEDKAQDVARMVDEQQDKFF